jgi:hypothetical protein
MKPQTFRENLMLTILEGLMLRHKEPGYSDAYAINEAHRLAKEWCNGSPPNSEQVESCQQSITQGKTPANTTPGVETCPECDRDIINCTCGKYDDFPGC